MKNTFDYFCEVEKNIKYIYGLKVKENPEQEISLRLQLTGVLHNLRESLEINHEEYIKYSYTHRIN